MTIHVVSVSGGKDSTATALLALEQHGREACRFVFADTGNEHALTLGYLDYLRLTLDIRIDVVRASFAEEIANKRMFIARDNRTRRVNGRRIRWSNRRKREALAVLRPTGNPFLDLCLWKGRFPSRKAQFCTQHLKTIPLVEYQMALIDQGFEVWSWQGVRRDESQNRRNALEFEPQGAGLSAYRPIVDWTAQQTVDYVRSRGLLLNPLYSLGMGRVGCMPCINANKAELKEIGRRFPLEVARIHQWEGDVGEVSKLRAATFIPAPGITPAEAKDHGIYAVIKWANTTRGGKQFDLLGSGDAPACSSSYGLCE